MKILDRIRAWWRDRRRRRASTWIPVDSPQRKTWTTDDRESLQRFLRESGRR
jgi:hypothetical protein